MLTASAKENNDNNNDKDNNKDKNQGKVGDVERSPVRAIA